MAFFWEPGAWSLGGGLQNKGLLWQGAAGLQPGAPQSPADDVRGRSAYPTSHRAFSPSGTLCSRQYRRNFTDSQYPNHAKTSRQVPPSHHGLAPPGLPDGPDVPGGTRWPRVSGACTGAQAASSKYSQRMSLASLCPAQTSPLGWRSRRRLPLPASLHILNAAMPKAVGA